MVDLHRHLLVRLNAPAWAGVVAREEDPSVREILAHWQAHDLPLVVTRQSRALADTDQVALGLPAPTRWQRRRLGLSVDASALRARQSFPILGKILPLATSPAAREAMLGLQQGLFALGVRPHVYGSHGWQAITGMTYLRPGSDLDLWMLVRDAAQADQAAALLRAVSDAMPRVDAEFVFPCGSAVAWREWDAWRAGDTRAVLAKSLFDVELHEDPAWCDQPVERRNVA